MGFPNNSFVEEDIMLGSKIGWIFPIIVLVTLLIVIWYGISQGGI